MRMARRIAGLDKPDHQMVSLARDFQRDLFTVEPHRAAAFAPHRTADHLARNLPLALAKHVIDGGGDGSEPPRDLALRCTRRKSARKFLRDKAGGEPTLAPARMVHQRRQKRNVVPDAVDIK